MSRLLHEIKIENISGVFVSKVGKDKQEHYCFSLTKIENISIENLDKLSVLLLSLKNFNIIRFIMIPRFLIYSILLTLCLHTLWQYIGLSVRKRNFNENHSELQILYPKSMWGSEPTNSFNFLRLELKIIYSMVCISAMSEYLKMI